MLLGPFGIGLGVAWRFDIAVLWMLLAVVSLFLMRQPMTILVKSLFGRRSHEDVLPASVWMMAYGMLIATFVVLLAASGCAAILWLALPALPPLAWQLWLVTRRSERQMSVELAGSGALALTAPAAYLAAIGRFDVTAPTIWGICWFQSAAAIVYIYLRLEQRRLATAPACTQQWVMGRRAVLVHAINFGASIVLAAFHIFPSLVPLAFGAMLAEAVRGTFRPAVGAKPQTIGSSQVGATLLFMGLVVLAYRLGI